jgi:large subunit ribosomal protein L30
MEHALIAIIRIHGKVGLRKGIKETLTNLRLYNKHTCIVVPNNPVFIGMITKIKDYITWGEINEPTLRELLLKRGRVAGKLPLTDAYLKEHAKISFDNLIKEIIAGKKQLKDIPGCKPFFKLTPPRGGYERGGTKQPYSLGGALGYRKDKISDLILKMI